MSIICKSQISYLIVEKKKKRIEHISTKEKRATLSNMGVSRMKLDTCGIWLNLKILDVSFNKINYIPEIMSLEELFCGHCLLEELPAYLPLLRILHCPNNKIGHMEHYLNLITLNCSHNKIRNLTHQQVPNLLQLTIDSNPIQEITCKKLVLLSAIRCPLMIVHKNKSMMRRINDSYITKEIIDRTCPLFIDWRIGKCKFEFLFKSIFPNNTSAQLIYKLLFK